MNWEELGICVVPAWKSQLIWTFCIAWLYRSGWLVCIEWRIAVTLVYICAPAFHILKVTLHHTLLSSSFSLSLFLFPSHRIPFHKTFSYMFNCSYNPNVFTLYSAFSHTVSLCRTYTWKYHNNINTLLDWMTFLSLSLSHTTHNTFSFIWFQCMRMCDKKKICWVVKRKCVCVYAIRTKNKIQTWLMYCTTLVWLSLWIKHMRWYGDIRALIITKFIEILRHCCVKIFKLSVHVPLARWPQTFVPIDINMFR